jgi:endonuclease YncB( thermonuclease family)
VKSADAGSQIKQAKPATKDGKPTVATKSAEPVSATAEPASALRPLDELTGKVSSIRDTATLIVDGKTVKLFGVEGRGAPYIQDLQRYVARFEGKVKCKPKKKKYNCFVGPKSDDIARAAILNGIAAAAPDAPPAYRDAQAQAQLGQKGMWKGANSSPPPPQ